MAVSGLPSNHPDLRQSLGVVLTVLLASDTLQAA